MNIMINPGTNIRGDGVAPDDVAAALAKEAGSPSLKRVGGPDDLGYFEYVFTTPMGRDVDVRIPSIPLEQFHEPMPPRVYVDGSSWMWELAVGWLRDWDKMEEESAREGMEAPPSGTVSADAPEPTREIGLLINCDKCRRPLKVQGGLLFGPPGEAGRSVKLHVCIECWDDVLAALEPDEGTD